VNILEQPVFSGERSRPFGELTRDEVAARAAELRAAAGGGGPTARVLPVALAWAELARIMDREGVRKVAELDENALAQRAERLWIVPPGGTLLP
jgi:hypothetical protein